MKDIKEVKPRSIASVIMWLGYLVIVFIAMDKLDTWAALIAFVVMMPLIAATGMMWGVFSSDSDKKQDEMSSEEIEKRKRERIDAVLRDLSDEDLLRLRKRLVDGTVDDAVLYDQIVGDDGELIVNRASG